MKIKLANNSTISFQELNRAHYQLFELMVYFLSQNPGKTIIIRNAIIDNNLNELPEDIINFMKKKQILNNKNEIGESIKNVCESYIGSDGSFNKTFLKEER